MVAQILRYAYGHGMTVPPASSIQRPTIVTLSRAMGVAPSTISRALRGDTRISAKTRARIARLAQDLGYTPHASARTMSSGRSGLIGVVLGASENPFYTELLHASVEQAALRGLRLLIIHAGAGPIENKTADALLQYQVDGCIITSAELPSNVGEVCAANGVPVVMVNRIARQHTSAVTCDNINGSAQLADVLIQAGRRRIAVIGTSSSSSTGQDREAGFNRYLETVGLRPVLRLDGQSTYEGGFEAGQHIGRLLQRDRPDAVFAVSDIMAFGILDAFRLAGLSVPSDVAVVGFDGLPHGSRPIYNLTTIEQPVVAMTSRALDLLQARMSDNTLPDETSSLKGALVLRGSSGDTSSPQAALRGPHHTAIPDQT